MPRITFVKCNGTENEVVGDAGRSVMESARLGGVDGIEGDCGGNLSCATCHVYVDEQWMDKLDAMAAMENELLDVVASERKANSRLSCQLILSDALDGMRVSIPEAQY
jgi:ferredoxin, 2Fe-2S